MKKTLLFIAMLCVSHFVQAQDTLKYSSGGEEVLWIEQKPEFPGGEAALMKFTADNIKYPMAARIAEIEGEVVTQFVIDKDGSVIRAKILKGIGAGCDEEALRVVNAMPKWKPGTQNGVLVKVQFTMLIKFTLDKPKK